jgi:hypothetical protein
MEIPAGSRGRSLPVTKAEHDSRYPETASWNGAIRDSARNWQFVKETIFL